MEGSRFNDSANLFGVGGTATHGEIKCDICGRVYHKSADDNEDYDNEAVRNTDFADLTVVECCFYKVENEVFNRMQAIIPWYKKILDARQIALTRRKESLDSLFAAGDALVFEADDEFMLVEPEMVLYVDDYIEGIELVSAGPRKVRGWVDVVGISGTEVVVEIQCDDDSNGHRGSAVHGRFGMRKARQSKQRPKI